jgi:hypothetical protein
MPFGKNANSYRREVAARLKRLAGFGPMVDGSLVVVRRRCGNPRCRCARGEKHPAHYLMRKVGGKTRSLYIPVALVKDVRAWNQEFRRLKRLVAEICERQRKVVAAMSAERRSAHSR